MFCYTAGTDVPVTRKTTNDKKQTATTTATKTKTTAETETVAATSTTKTNTCNNSNNSDNENYMYQEGNGNKQDNRRQISRGFFYCPFKLYSVLVQPLNSPDRYINNNNKTATKNISNNSSKQRTTLLDPSKLLSIPQRCLIP